MAPILIYEWETPHGTHRSLTETRWNGQGPTRVLHCLPLTPAEVQSGMTRVRWAENLILQLPKNHEGRNSWLMNYAQDRPADLATSDPEGHRQAIADHEAEAPKKDQRITLHWQGRVDGTNEGFEVNGMLAIGDSEGVTYITREQAAEFFGFTQPTQAEAPRTPTLAKRGETLGAPHPDWPEWCTTFRERLAYQHGIADARAALATPQDVQGEDDSEGSWKALPDRLRGRGDWLRTRGRVKDAELMFDAATEIEGARAALATQQAVQPEPVADLTPSTFCYLVEHFLGDGTGNSTGHYHTGFVDLAGASRTTKDPYQAKRYATWREANNAAMKLGTTLSGTWVAVQHGFAYPHPPIQAAQQAVQAEQPCNCPCCREGISAPHEYHLERRPMVAQRRAGQGESVTQVVRDPSEGCECGPTCEDRFDGCRYATPPAPGQVERDREDAELLDYLQSSGSTVEIWPNQTGWTFRVGGLHRAISADIREAIRAARSSEGGDALARGENHAG